MLAWTKQALRRALGARQPDRDGRQPAAPPQYAQWSQLLAAEAGRWQAARAAARNGPQVLIATSTGGHPVVTPVESLLAVALTLRGAQVHFLLCDEFLPACDQAYSALFEDQTNFVRHGPARTLCDACYATGAVTYQPLGLPVYRYSQLVGAAERKQARAIARSLPAGQVAGYCLDGLAIGEHALAGALRYFAKGDLADEPDGEAVLRRYLEGAVLTAYAARRALTKADFEVVCLRDGIYVPHGLVGEAVRQSPARVATWVTAYRKQCFIFSHEDTYHHTLLSEPVSAWEDLAWGPTLDAELMDYLKSRWYGTHDWISFHEKPERDLEAIAAELGLDFSRPVIGMLTNVIWDAQLHYPANAFPNMLDWTLQTIRYFAGRPNLQLVIRVHPAEIRGTLPSRQPMMNEIHKAFPNLPANVFVIPPESAISTYAVMLRCDSVIIYGTKTGVELTSFGLPVIVAGEAWIRNKGLTRDARTRAEYFQLLDQLPARQKLDEATLTRARRYAYHFFFRRMIPLAAMTPTSGWPPFQMTVASLDDLRPGRDLGLDVICRGILEGADFIYPAELQAQPAI